MFDEDGETSSPSAALVSLPGEAEWQPILHASNQVVLYNPTSHALTVQHHASSSSGIAQVVRRVHTSERCPFCHRPMEEQDRLSNSEFDEEIDRDLDETPTSRVANYFQLLQVANESSVPPTPRSPSPLLDAFDPSPVDTGLEGEDTFPAENMAEGYFEAFFREDCRLGMGANGSVFLCEHVLNGNSLGRFAVKKIAVGRSHSYLMNTLREVRLLEQLHHPNIITYHHAWLETCRFSSFGPKVPALHVLMQWAEGGSLDDFIDARLGRSSNVSVPHFSTSGQSSGAGAEAEASSTPYSRSARIRAFRALQHATPEERARLRRELAMSASAGQCNEGNRPDNWLAVHLLSAEEVKALFSDVVAGLAFLHERSILHLDLKPGNVLLTWEQGKLIPKAMLSDFGTSQDMLNSRTRSGNTGTLEYTSPESLPSPATGFLTQLDSKSDMWSLGMILHKLLFFRLPYEHASDNLDQDSKRDGKVTADALEREVLTYPGFKPTSNVATLIESRHLPRAFLFLLEGLLNVNPSIRPSSERVQTAIREGRLDPIVVTSRRTTDKTSLVPLRRSVPPEQPQQTGSAIGIGPSLPDPEPVSQEKLGDDVPTHSSLGLPPIDNDGRLSPMERRVSRPGVSRLVLTRTLKSSLLVVKVLSLTAVDKPSRISLVLRGLALTTAVIDTWFDDLRISMILGLVHAGFLLVLH